MTRVLALDIGTSSVRAHVFDESAVEGSPARRASVGETDPDALVAMVRSAIEEASPRGFDVVSAASLGHSLLALDGHGRPLTRVLGWHDMRATGDADRLATLLDASAVHDRTGCHIHTTYWPAKLAWLAREQPDVFRSTHRFVSFVDYVYMQLLRSSDVPASASLASGTGLVDVRTSAYDAELLDVLGLDEERFPRISNDPVGDWYPAWMDGLCANIGAGCVGRERASLTIGTSSALRTVYPTDDPRPRPGLFLYRIDEQRVVEGGALSDGGNLNGWLARTLVDAEGSLADRDPDSHGLTFLTLLGGERSTGWHGHATGAIHGLTLDTTALDLRQAALEGVAFRLAEVLDLMPEVEEIVATGGALVGDAEWCQIVSDALARPIVVSGVREASLRGAAVTVLERIGVRPAPAPLGRRFEPRPERAQAYRAARERQQAVYRAATGTDTS